MSTLRRLLGVLSLGLMLSALNSPAGAQDPDPALEKARLAEKAHGVLKTYCYRCHGIDFKVEGLNVLELKTLVAPRDGNKPFIAAGKSEDSVLWRRMGIDADMPPEDQKQPSAEEKAIIKAWIEAGAPDFPSQEKRRFLKTLDVLNNIRADLKQTDPADRPFQKYFTLNQLHNNRNISPLDLRLGRAALSKLLNSLSWKRGIVVPESVNEEETVYTVDIRTLGWERKNLWREVQKLYPFGLTYEDHEDQDVRELAKEVADLSGDQLCWVRADWFISTASRPPLYHTMLDIPDQVEKLRVMLNVNVQADFKDNLLARGAFATSQVSKQNRVVDRHFALYGYYWESYDFKPNDADERGNVFKFPLGPVFDENEFNDQAFKHDGGEIIYSLPNGMQAYMLVDSKGNRIDEGPTDVVYDSLNTGGNVAVINGLSCMACHQQGMRTFKDTMRAGQGLDKSARDKVQRLVPRQADMDLLVRKDTDRFLRALEACVGPFLQVGDDKLKPITDFPEAVGTVSLLYVKDLGVEEVALEMGIEDSSEVAGIVNGNRLLKRAGLGPLAVKGTIKREVWTALIKDRDPPANPFHVMAEQLEQGEALQVK